VNAVHLPIADFRDQILDSVSNSANPVTIITAATGAGKSTQVPQYLLDAGYNVVVTQPRRLAARTLAERVAEEMGTKLGEVVGYQTSQEKFVSDETRCLFVTDGLQLVNELLNIRRTRGSTVLVLDEVHEWNLNIEVLIAWVKEQIIAGRDIKMVLMSATIEAEKLSKFFNDAPVINVPGRLFPVTVAPCGTSLLQDVVNLADNGHNILVFQPGKAEIEKLIGELEEHQGRFVVLPLHGELDSAEQKKCFQHYGKPKIIVSTNVAQTSVTIDDIDAVVDSGLERRLELDGGVEGLYLKPISLADSKQRAGRAGRTKPGIYIDWCVASEDRLEFPKAEIERVRLDQTILRLADIGFDMEKLAFFHEPDHALIHKTKEELKKLGCMDQNGRVTPIGRSVSRLPISVPYARMVIAAESLGVVKDIITIAAILETGELNARKTQDGRENYAWRGYIKNEKDSDLIAQLNLYNAAEQMRPPEMAYAGIHIGAFYRARTARRNIEQAVRRYVRDVDCEGTKENILEAVCAGMVNHVYQRNYGSYSRSDDDKRRQLNRESVFTGLSDFVIALPFDLEIKTRFGNKVLNLLRMVSKVDAAVLMRAAPHLVETRKGLKPYWAYSCGVKSTTETVFNGVVISSVEVYDPDHPDAVNIKIDNMYTSYSKPYIRCMHYDSFTPVPQPERHLVGTHPTTGEDLYFYAMQNDRVEIQWTRNEQDALVIRNKLIDYLCDVYNKTPEWIEEISKKKSLAQNNPLKGRVDVSKLLEKFGK